MRASARGALVVAWTLACAASALAGDAYEITTPGSPGTGGAVPALAGDGAASPGSANSLLLADALPHAPALLVFSVSELAAPFAGGVLGPAPEFIASLGITGADGALERRFRVPDNAPVGLELWLQAWVRDAGGAAGFAASNTLKVTVRPEVPVELMYPGAVLELEIGVADIAAGDLDSDGCDELVVARSDLAGVRVLRNVGDGSFEDPYQILQGAASAVRLGDVNGDGATDVAVGMQAMPRVNVLLGDGAGGFSDPTPVVLPANPTHVWLIDLDGDAVLDLVASHFGSADVSVCLGVGDGSFGAVLPHAPGGALASLTVADLDGDGVPDLVGAVTPFVFPLQRYIAVSLGVGDGTFAEAVLTPTGGAVATDITVVDLDGDGLLDVIVAKEPEAELSWHRGLGDGALAPSQALLAGAQPVSVLAEDFDRDGVADLAVANQASNHLSVFLVTPGSGMAPEPQVVPTSLGPTRLVALELQGDDCPDLAALSMLEFDETEPLSLHAGAGEGVFHAATRLFVSPSMGALALTDLDADGVLDVVAADSELDQLIALMGNGAGAFETPTAYDTEDSLGRIVAEDFDGDERDEVLVSLVGGQLQLFDVSSSGALVDPVVLDAGVDFISHFQVGDLDDDGDLDVVGASGGAPEFWMLLGAGDGTFGPPVHVELSGAALGVTLHDLNGDGLLDVVFTDASVSFSVHLNLGGAAFSEGVVYPLSGSSFFGASVFAGDLDGDGAADLVSVAAHTPGDVAVRLGKGDGSFDPPSYFDAYGDLHWLLYGVALTDLDGDGHLDLLGEEDDLFVLRGDGAGGFEPSLLFGAGGYLGDAQVGDLDEDGAPDIVAITDYGPRRLTVLRNLRAR